MHWFAGISPSPPPANTHPFPNSSLPPSRGRDELGKGADVGGCSARDTRAEHRYEGRRGGLRD